ncbi:beta-galactosidase [Parapedobacter composti]|uniref:Beta-galactosidase n=1 Tax=Parapedobacter composti TaxID=623281 RepID=A0A1I1GUH4_9SPHI|nr:beta-galactosidase GalB [Parapedobacter composti]SFC15106.1 beta-galactosidase [Parapedobacter composti]
MTSYNAIITWGWLVAVVLTANCRPVGVTAVPKDDDRTEFNVGWKFQLGDDSLAMAPGYDDADWRVLDLPHDWSIEGSFSADHPAGNAGGALPGGIGWYRKRFDVPENAEGRMLYIDFDGIYRNSEVWINGHYLGKRPYGYSAFRYDLTPYLFSRGEPNVIAVRVDNSAQPNSRWYSGSGIYRNVHLVARHPVGVAHWGAFVTTPRITDEHALVIQHTELENLTGEPQQLTVVLSVFDNQGQAVGSVERDFQLADSMGVLDLLLEVPNPKRWSVDSPVLYHAVTTVKQGNKVLDRHVERFGIREFRFDVQGGFSLNGVPTRLHGVCMHHDLGALGAAVNRRAMERQLEILRTMGANAIRISHNPPAKEFLELCDEKGFLVVNEAFDMWRKRKTKFDYHIDFDAWHERDLRDLVRRDRNHPSVILWSIGNEIREQFDSTGITITRDLVNIVKSEDTTRPVTAALTETEYGKNFIAQAEVLDVLGFNYKYADYPRLPTSFPGRPLYASETTSALQTRGHYEPEHDTLRFWPASGAQKYVENGNPDYTVSAYDHVAAYWGTRHETAWSAVKSADYLAGLFVWTGFDYLGEPVPYPFPARSSYYGIVDLAGFPKDVYYMYQSEWTDEPVLHIFPHWNWNAGDTVAVWAYYNNADEVELLLNGKSLGSRRKEDGALHVAWDVPFEPGQVKAISRKSGQVVLERTVNTAGPPASIRLTADRNTVRADGQDLSFVTVEVIDKEGNLVPDAALLIHFSVDGPGEVAAVDNGYQASLEPFQDTKRKTFNGKCLVIIRPGTKSGVATVRAHAEGLADATVGVKMIVKR